MSFDWAAYDRENAKYEMVPPIYRKLYGMYCKTCEKNKVFNRLVRSDRYVCCNCGVLQESLHELEIGRWSQREKDIWRACELFYDEADITVDSVYRYTTEDIAKEDIRAFFARIGRPIEEE